MTKREDSEDLNDIHPTWTPQRLSTSTRIMGDYRILQRVGVGGMGEVFQAEQVRPVRRTVALKIIKPGMDSKEVIARFESERQALALMNHPNIARVFDAGVTDEGRPFFAMEYAEGVPIDKYCDMHRLRTRDRLDLFVQVCDGVQHAHQKGIIHRDIKPSNVLVTIQDEKPVPKIIDFGVAKATAFRLTERTMFTELGQLIGTPAYMSPEQVELTGLDIDIRTDVYSLGVLLYELLVGALPFDITKAVQSGLDEVRRKIREEEPPRPSNRVSTLGVESAATAEKRATDGPALAKRLRGDLDWIIMKALEKDRTRRYASVSELSGDIIRHLGNEPVLAGPPGTLYRVEKYVRRHKFGVAFATVVLTLLAASAVTTAIQANRIAKERDRANQEATRAGQEAHTAREVSEFLEGLFEVSDPSEALGNTVTAREILDRGAERVERELHDQPVVQARFMEVIGRVYRSLGLYTQAGGLLERAVATRRQQTGNDAELAGSLKELGHLHYLMEDYSGARSSYEEARAIAERVLGPDHLDLAPILDGLAHVHHERAEYDEARDLYRRALEIREKELGPDHPDVAASVDNLADVHWRRGEYEDAWLLHEHALEIREKSLDPDHPAVASSLDKLGLLYRRNKEYDRAREVYERALRIRERTLGPDHPAVADSMQRIGNLHFELREYETALEWYQRALVVRQAVLGADGVGLSSILNNVASVHFTNDRYDDARVLYERVLRIQEQARGPNHPDVAAALRNLALLDKKTGDHDLARTRFLRVLEIRSRVLGPDHVDLAGNHRDLGRVEYLRGEYDLARISFERAAEIWEKHGDSRAARGYYDLACLSAVQGDRRAALGFLRRAVDLGYADPDILGDPDLEPFRDDPEFRSVAAEVENRPRGGRDAASR